MLRYRMTAVPAVLLLVAGLTGPVHAADWTVTYGLDEDKPDSACRVALDATGNIYVLSNSTNDNDDVVATITKFSPGDTSIQLQCEYRAPDTDLAAVDLALSAPTGSPRIYVAVKLDTGSSPDIYRIVAFKANGDTAWVRGFRNDVPGSRLVGIAARGGASPGVVAVGCGYVSAVRDTDYLVATYSFTGVPGWTANFDGHSSGGYDDSINYNDWATAIACDANGNVFVTGQANSAMDPPNDYEICTVRYNADGSLSHVAWQNQTEADDEDELEDCGVDVDVRLNNYAYVTGRFMNYAGEDSEWEDNYDVTTICYGADNLYEYGVKTYGDSKWCNEEPVEVAIAGSDEAVVVMRSTDTNDYVSAVTARYHNASPFKEAWARSIFLGDDSQGPVGVAAAGVNPTMSAIAADQDPTESGDDDFMVSLFEPTGFQRRTWVYDEGEEAGSQRAADIAIFPYLAGQGGDTFVVTVGTTGEGDESDIVVMRRDYPNGWIWAEAGENPHHPMPSLPSNSAVKDGGWLACDSSSGLIYAAKGNKTADFYWYSPATNSWSPTSGSPALALIPPGIEGKLPRKGCAGCVDPTGHIYMTKGNNTLEFWRYGIASDSWYHETDVPLGESRKKVKGGTDIVWAKSNGTNYAYLLKGYRNEFYKYNTASDSWYTLRPAPVGANQKWDKGSWLAYDGAHTIYAHKANYHEFWKFDTDTDSWNTTPLVAMPIPGSGGRKKSKDGGCGVWAGDMILALKGGNTQESWAYYPVGNVWDERDTVPKVGSTLEKKKVKAGADIVNAGGTIYAMKGNKSREIWRYAPAGGDELVMYAGSSREPREAMKDDESPVTVGLEAYDPCWNSDGSAVVLCREDSLNWFQIYEVVSPGGVGTEARLTDIETDCEQPRYSSQDDKVCFALLDSSGFYQIAVVDLDTTDGGGRTDGSEATVAPVQAISAQGQVPRRSDVGDITVRTSEAYDHTCPSFSPSGDYICYVRESNDGDEDIWRVPADSGSEEQLTDCGSSHEDPVWLNDSEIVFTHVPDEDYDQIAKLVITTETETDLTSSEYDHARPDVRQGDSIVCFEVMDDYGTQIAKVSSSGGSETFLTSGNRDMEAPNWSNGQSIFCARWTGITSAICFVDATNGGFTAVTDSSAIRDNPDAWYDLSVSTSNIVYEREEWDPLDLFGNGGRKKWGTGVFLTHHRRPHDGEMGASLYTLALERAEPNPVTNRVRIRYQVPAEAEVSLRIYNTAGQLVKVLADGLVKPGAYTSVWNGTDTKGRRLANGVYFYALDNGAKRISRKLVLTD